jgi:hypothetical protein
MKLRLGFVSNSSASSFIVSKKNLSEKQIYMINHQLETCKNIIKNRKIVKFNEFENIDPYGEENWQDMDGLGKLEMMMEYINKGDEWIVENRKNNLFLWTIMDNFDIRWFLENVVEVDPIDIKKQSKRKAIDAFHKSIGIK